MVGSGKEVKRSLVKVGLPRDRYDNLGLMIKEIQA